MGFGVGHVKTVTVPDWSGTVTVANSTGGTTTAAASDLARPSDWNSRHIVFAETGFYEAVMPMANNTSLQAPGIGTWYIAPHFMAHGLDSGQINIMMADAAGFLNGAVFSAASTGSITRYQTLNNMLALYSRGTGTASSLLSRLWSSDFSILATWERRLSAAATSNLTVSNYLTLSFPSQWDASGGVTYGSTSQSGTTSVGASTGASTLANNLITGAVARVTGSRFMPFGLNISIEADNYWLAHCVTSTSSSTGTNYSAGTMFSTQSRLYLLDFVGAAYKLFGQSVSNSSTAYQRWHGFVNTTSSAPFATLATSDVRPVTTTGHGRLYWNYQKTTY